MSRPGSRAIETFGELSEEECGFTDATSNSGRCGTVVWAHTRPGIPSSPPSIASKRPESARVSPRSGTGGRPCCADASPAAGQSPRTMDLMFQRIDIAPASHNHVLQPARDKQLPVALETRSPVLRNIPLRPAVPHGKRLTFPAPSPGTHRPDPIPAARSRQRQSRVPTTVASRPAISLIENSGRTS